MSRYIEPTYEGSIRGYVLNFLKRYMWRIELSMTIEDGVQEGYIVFARVLEAYPRISMGPHFMALFKTAWLRHFTDLANADTALRCLVPLDIRKDAHTEQGEDSHDETELDTIVGSLDNDGYLACKLREAPAEVKAVLSLFLNAPTDILELALRGWKGRDKRKRVGGSEHLNRLLGLHPDMDVLAITERYFSD